MIKIILFILLAISLAGCASVTATPDHMPKTASVPTFEERKHFYLWGLTPSSRYVDVAEVCGDRDVRQIEAQTTFTDGLLGLITLGIYSPRTIKIWCMSGGAA